MPFMLKLRDITGNELICSLLSLPCPIRTILFILIPLLFVLDGLDRLNRSEKLAGVNWYFPTFLLV